MEQCSQAIANHWDEHHKQNFPFALNRLPGSTACHLVSPLYTELSCRMFPLREQLLVCCQYCWNCPLAPSFHLLYYVGSLYLGVLKRILNVNACLKEAVSTGPEFPHDRQCETLPLDLSLYLPLLPLLSLFCHICAFPLQRIWKLAGCL